MDKQSKRNADDQLEGRSDGDPVLSPGHVFAGRYRIEELLGVGGFAKVYRAEQTDIGREVAIKVLDPERTGADEGLSTAEKRFYREARLMSKLEGPNTVRLYDYGRSRREHLYTVFEYIDGTDLDDLMRADGPFDEERTRRILRQILRSLHEAHSESILHRDVKPSNVMVFDRAGERDRVKLLDFGIAKMVAAEAGGQQQLTIEGMVVGTPRYMSPEQMLGQPLGPPSDLFGVGLLVYEMLVGNSPFDSAELSMVRRRIDSAPIRLPMGTDVSDELRDLTNRLLEREIEDRVQSTREALSALGVELTAADDNPSRSRDRTRQGVSFPIGLDSSGVSPVDDLTGTTDQTATLQSGTGLVQTGSSPARETPSGAGSPEPFGSAPTVVDPDVRPPANERASTEGPPEDRAPPPEAASAPPNSKEAASSSSPSPRAARSTAPSTEDARSELTGLVPNPRHVAALAVLTIAAVTGGWWAWEPSASSSTAEPRATTDEGRTPTDSPPAAPSEPTSPTPDPAVSVAQAEASGSVTRAAATAGEASREAAEERKHRKPTPEPDRRRQPRPEASFGGSPETDGEREPPPSPPSGTSSESDDGTEIKPIDEYLAE